MEVDVGILLHFRVILDLRASVDRKIPTIFSQPNEAKLINPPARPSPTLHIRTRTSHDFDVSCTRRGVARGGG